jgi:hypothetical protein
MSRPALWTRRSVLKSFGWVVAIAATRPLAAMLSQLSVKPADYPDIDVRLLFRQPGSAAFLGRLYLQKQPEERSGTALRDLIWRECTEQEQWVARTGQQALQQVLSARQTRDFASGQTVLLDGWVVSRTEARLYALAALSV